MGKLIGRTVPVSELSTKQKEALWQLMDRHYVNVSPTKFINDLLEKDHVILLEDLNCGHICGFSTVKIMSTFVLGHSVQAVFSGDTIIDPAFWGEQGLVREFGMHLISVFKKFPNSYCCWFLISKGYKTYRYLPLYFNEFFPRYDRATPKFEKAVLDTLASEKYPGLYDHETGIIRLNGMSDRLREGIADVTDKKLQNTHVRFFAEKNPRHIYGDELACIAELNNKNLKNIFFRIVLGKKA